MNSEVSELESAQALEREVLEVGEGNVSALITEPIQDASGIAETAGTD